MNRDSVADNTVRVVLTLAVDVHVSSSGLGDELMGAVQHAWLGLALPEIQKRASQVTGVRILGVEAHW